MMVKNQVDGNQMITFTTVLYMVLESTLFVQEEVQKWEILLCKSKHRVKLVLLVNALHSEWEGSGEWPSGLEHSLFV